jgi:aminoglycoside phosphotransferase family enzyme/predicted kinase
VSGPHAQGELSGGPSARSPLESARVLDALAQPEAYPLDASAHAPRWIQTHLSHVFLTGERVYKFRKPVDLGFVHFETLAARNDDCLNEVVLNRRLAPDVYLGIAPLESDGNVRVGEPAEALASETSEHCVVMRRLPEGRDALSLLTRGALSGEQVDRLARRIARFHAAHPLRVPAPRGGWLHHCTRPAWSNFDALRGSLVGLQELARLERLEGRAGEFARRSASVFEARYAAGRAVNGHGDLHLQHVWFERDDDEPIAIDCVEFDAELRRIDGASEVAFLSMDLRYRGAEALAERFLRSYAAERDDYELYRVVDWFESYRAAVRAKVAAIAAGEQEIDASQRERACDSARRHLDLALRVLEAERRPSLVLVCGAVGTGKSTLASALAERLDAVVIGSDRVRKHQLGLPSGQRAPEAAYRPAAKRAVYEALLARADAVIASGRTAILDATWGERAERLRAHAFASARRVRAHLVETRAAASVARARLERRARQGRDASDAGPELYDASVAGFEPPVEWPAARRHVIETHSDDWRAGLAPLADALRGAAACRPC